jgi:site-specific recombinase XerD
MGKSLASIPAKEKRHSPFVEEIIHQFLLKHQNSLDRSKNTLRSYRSTLQIFFEFMELRQSITSAKNLQSVLTGESLRDYFREIASALDPRSHAHHCSVIRSFIRWAQSESLLTEALERHIESPKIGKKVLRVQSEEFTAHLALELRKGPCREEELLFHLLYGSGLRISEASQLTWKDLNIERQLASILGKGRKRRELPLTKRACELLKELGRPEKDSMRIWTRASSSRTHRRWVDGWQRFQADSEAPDLHPHQLRHSIATHLLQRGAGLPQIQRLLGHSRLETTQNYTHLDLKDLQKIYSRARPRLKKG